METGSCSNCSHIDRSREEHLTGRLEGRYRYGCSYTKSGYIVGTVLDEDGLSLLTCPGYEGNRKKAVPDREPTQEYEEKLQSLFDRWAAWNRSGSPDAKVTDGIYLNRLRQGILRMQKEIERCIPEEQYPECYYAMVPPMKAEDYMVSPDKIERTARDALAKLQENADFEWISEHIRALKKEDREYETACRIIRHRDQLKAAIEANDILGMKQGCRQDNLIRELRVCRKQLEIRQQKRTRKRQKPNRTVLEGQLTLVSIKAS